MKTLGIVWAVALTIASLLGACAAEPERGVPAGDAAILDADPADTTVSDLGILDGGATDGGPFVPVEWVPLPGGAFQMGDRHSEESQPVHEVTVPAFDIARTEVTVEQYQACQAAGACAPTPQAVLDRRACNVHFADRARYPMNCVTQADAAAFAAWVGGRLPSEAEWEYAARSAGRLNPYPWGATYRDCEHAIVAYPEDPEGPYDQDGCGTGHMWPVCSRPQGNSLQGVCDLVGNAAELVEDDYCSYLDTPRDGTTAACACPQGNQCGITRGGAFLSRLPRTSAWYRSRYTRTDNPLSGSSNGIRVVRDPGGE